MKQRFLSIFLVLALIIPFFPQVTLPAKAAETTAKTQDLLPVRRGFLLMKITSKSMQKPKWQILILFITTIKS